MQTWPNWQNHLPTARGLGAWVGCQAAGAHVGTGFHASPAVAHDRRSCREDPGEGESGGQHAVLACCHYSLLERARLQQGQKQGGSMQSDEPSPPPTAPDVLRRTEKELVLASHPVRLFPLPRELTAEENQDWERTAWYSLWCTCTHHAGRGEEKLLWAGGTEAGTHRQASNQG